MWKMSILRVSQEMSLRMRKYMIIRMIIHALLKSTFLWIYVKIRHPRKRIIVLAEDHQSPLDHSDPYHANFST